MSTLTPLLPGQYYHIYNRGNNRENIFQEERNYAYFLNLYAKYIEPVGETYAYCLLRNHFHFSVRIRENLTDPDPSQAFSNLFNAYARAFNNAYARTGALFQRPFGRILVTSNAYFIQLIVYIHRNPEKHGFVTDFREWPYSSYHAHLSVKPTSLEREKVLAWFDGLEHFTGAHSEMIDEKQVAVLAPEDFD